MLHQLILKKLISNRFFVFLLGMFVSSVVSSMRIEEIKLMNAGECTASELESYGFELLDSDVFNLIEKCFDELIANHREIITEKKESKSISSEPVFIGVTFVGIASESNGYSPSRDSDKTKQKILNKKMTWFGSGGAEIYTHKGNCYFKKEAIGKVLCVFNKEKFSQYQLSILKEHAFPFESFDDVAVAGYDLENDRKQISSDFGIGSNIEIAANRVLITSKNIRERLSGGFLNYSELRAFENTYKNLAENIRAYSVKANQCKKRLIKIKKWIATLNTLSKTDRRKKFLREITPLTQVQNHLNVARAAVLHSLGARPSFTQEQSSDVEGFNFFHERFCQRFGREAEDALIVTLLGIVRKTRRIPTQINIFGNYDPCCQCQIKLQWLANTLQGQLNQLRSNGSLDDEDDASPRIMICYHGKKNYDNKICVCSKNDVDSHPEKDGVGVRGKASTRPRHLINSEWIRFIFEPSNEAYTNSYHKYVHDNKHHTEKKTSTSTEEKTSTSNGDEFSVFD